MPINFPQIAKPINTIGLLNFVGKKKKESEAENNCFTHNLDNTGFFFSFPKLQKLRETCQQHFQQLDPKVDSSFLLTKESTRTPTRDTETNLQQSANPAPSFEKGKKSGAPLHKLAYTQASTAENKSTP